MNRRWSARKISLAALMAALVFALSWMQISITETARLHLGNVMCLLAGLLLGPVYGGFAAGIGSAFFDLTNPLYIASLPFTFVFKFMMAYVCGTVAGSGKGKVPSVKRAVLGAVLGMLTYVFLYLGRNLITDHYFLRLEWETIRFNAWTKGITSMINGIIAVVVSVPLAVVLRKALQKNNLL